LRDAREQVRRLQVDEGDCVDRLALERRRLEDAQGRLSDARMRPSDATFEVGLDVTGFSLGEQAAAVDDIGVAEGDVRRAERAVEGEREELARLRRKASEEREDLEEAEESAAAAVRAAAGELPDVRLANGAVRQWGQRSVGSGRGFLAAGSAAARRRAHRRAGQQPGDPRAAGRRCSG